MIELKNDLINKNKNSTSAGKLKTNEYTNIDVKQFNTIDISKIKPPKTCFDILKPCSFETSYNCNYNIGVDAEKTACESSNFDLISFMNYLNFEYYRYNHQNLLN